MVFNKKELFYLHFKFNCSAPTGVELFLLTFFVHAINPFDLQPKINSEARIPSDFFYVKSYIGFPFGDSQYVILMDENGNKFIYKSSIKDQIKNLVVYF
jgi:hypothetical protein